MRQSLNCEQIEWAHRKFFFDIFRRFFFEFPGSDATVCGLGFRVLLSVPVFEILGEKWGRSVLVWEIPGEK